MQIAYTFFPRIRFFVWANAKSTGALVRFAIDVESSDGTRPYEGQLDDAGSSYGCMGTPLHSVNLSFGRGGVDDVGHKTV